MPQRLSRYSVAVDPGEALHSVETSLRVLIREVMGDAWKTAPGHPDVDAAQARRAEEVRRHNGAVISADLLDFTMHYELTTMVLRNWERFKVVFDDKKRTETFFDILEDYRNAIGHSRPLLPFERDLMTGIAGQLRNQIALYRSVTDGSTVFYPLIEMVRDSYGRSGIADWLWMAGLTQPSQRVDVGDLLMFDSQATDERQRTLSWFVFGDVNTAIVL